MSVMRVCGLEAELSLSDFDQYFRDYYKSVDKVKLHEGVGYVYFKIQKEAQNCAANPLPLSFGKETSMEVRNGDKFFETCSEQNSDKNCMPVHSNQQMNASKQYISLPEPGPSSPLRWRRPLGSGQGAPSQTPLASRAQNRRPNFCFPPTNVPSSSTALPYQMHAGPRFPVLSPAIPFQIPQAPGFQIPVHHMPQAPIPGPTTQPFQMHFPPFPHQPWYRPQPNSFPHIWNQAFPNTHAHQSIPLIKPAEPREDSKPVVKAVFEELEDNEKDDEKSSERAPKSLELARISTPNITNPPLGDNENMKGELSNHTFEKKRKLDETIPKRKRFKMKIKVVKKENTTKAVAKSHGRDQSAENSNDSSSDDSSSSSSDDSTSDSSSLHFSC